MPAAKPAAKPTCRHPYVIYRQPGCSVPLRGEYCLECGLHLKLRGRVWLEAGGRMDFKYLDQLRAELKMPPRMFQLE